MSSGSSEQYLAAGGAGFLGSHLCERLIDSGARVICLDNFQRRAARPAAADAIGAAAARVA